MFRAALFVIVPTGNNSNALQSMNGDQSVVHSRKGILLNNKKEGNIETCSHLDEPRSNRAERKKLTEKVYIL